MPESVYFDLVPPAADDIAKLHIYEASDTAGPWNEIEVLTAIGTYPGYISEYTTPNAVSRDDWFAIAWENASGVVGDMSAPIKPGTQTLVGQLVNRVRQRDSSLDENVVVQEAEAAIQEVLGEDVDPYDVTLNVSYRILSGLTYLILARSLILRSVFAAASAAQSWTVGMISLKGASNSTQLVRQAIEPLIELANKELGLSLSYILLLEDIEIGHSISSWQWDESRLVLEVGLE